MNYNPDAKISPPKAPRGYFKIAAVAAMLGIVLGVIITFAGRATLNSLRHHLTLGLVLAMAAVLNILSFLLFTAFWSVYRWLRPNHDADMIDADQDRRI